MVGAARCTRGRSSAESEGYKRQVDYVKMRALPITVFGTSSSGSFVDQTHRNPAEVMAKHLDYTDLEAQTPREETMEAWLTRVTQWVKTAKGGSKVTR